MTNYITVSVAGLIFWKGQLELQNSYTYRPNSREMSKIIRLQLVFGSSSLYFY